MEDRKKTKLHAVKTDTEEMESRIKTHKRKVLKRSAIVVLAFVLIIGGIYLYLSLKNYNDFEVLETQERSDTAATKFETYGAGVLKYSNDGAFYTDLDNNLIWNQTYEMQNPEVKISGDYVAIGDHNGSNLYIMDKTGAQGSVVTTMPIYAFDVAAQGTVAVLLKADAGYYLKLFDKTGSELASGQLHEKNSGYPVSISIAPDAKKMALSMIMLNAGKVSTTLSFYNFGSVGQNEQDNIVGTYSYDDMVIPEMEFVSNDTLVAFGDSQVQIYRGSQKPALDNTLDLEQEVKSIFYNDSYFGLVFNNEDEGNTRRMEIYDLKGSRVLNKDFSMDYSKIAFLSNDEICVSNANECQLYNLYGVERFHYQFDNTLYEVVPQYLGIYYTFILEGSTEKVRLR